jgi:hypothetical protein
MAIDERKPEMYLAPLNYDRYFRKVFSDIGIVKRLAAEKPDFRCRIGER